MPDDDKKYTKDDIDKAVKDAVGDLEKIKTNRDKALQQLAELREQFKPFKDLDPEEVKKALKEAAKANRDKAKSEGEYQKLLDQQKEDHEKELRKRDERIQKLEAEQDKNIRSRAIRQAMKEANIAEPFTDTVGAFLETKVALVGEGEDRAAKIGDKTPAEFLKEYVSSDNGKHYVRAGANSGGGSPGSGSTGEAGANPFKQGEHFNVTEQMKLKKSDPQKAARLQKQAEAANKSEK